MSMKQLEKFVFDFLEKYLDRGKYIYHSLEHTREVYADVRLFGRESGLSDAEIRLLEAAALFHDCGYVTRPEDHETGSAELAERYLPNFGFSKDEIEAVRRLIFVTRYSARAETLSESIMRDADIGNLGTPGFDAHSRLLRRELAMCGRNFDDEAWNRFEADFLGQVTYLSSAAQRLRGPLLEQHRKQYWNLAGKENKMIQSLDGHEHYEIVEKIAEGGMGMVFKARKIGAAGFEKIVAIKMMLKKFCDNDQSLEGFIGEAKLVANLIHENIVQIYQLEHTEEGYYFVLEFVDGISLHDFVELHTKLKLMIPRMLAVFIVSRVARGLAYAHTRRDSTGNLLGIVHCDICPRNILINSEGVPKITDFGIARVGHSFDGNKVSGKLAYMAPEQARREDVDARADIYSLGLVLFYLLAGKNARDTKQETTCLLKNVRSGALDWESLPKDLAPELLTMLKRMLAEKPGDRYANTSELARNLEYFIYKDGYGPTIVTLAEYMRKLFPGKFPSFDQPVEEIDKTVVI